MSFENREEIIKFVEEDYFGSAVRNDIDGVLASFEPNAKIMIRHGDNPVRRFAPNPEEGESSLVEFYEHLCGTFEVWFGNFKHFVDFEENKSACYFTVRLTPRSAEMLEEVGVQELQNCNFFRFSGKKIDHMIIYYSNTAAGASQELPTGYPT